MVVQKKHCYIHLRSERLQRIITEAALIGSIVEHGIYKDMIIVGDDAGQFDVFLHALCWIHATRAIAKIIPYSDQAEVPQLHQRSILDLYQKLKKYKSNPCKKDKRHLSA